MFHLGVDTTRAESGGLAGTGRRGAPAVVRPGRRVKPTPKIEMDDPRLARFPDEVKRQIIAQARAPSETRRDDRGDVRDHDESRAELHPDRARRFVRAARLGARAGLGRARAARADGQTRGVPGVSGFARGTRVGSEPPRDAHAERRAPLLASAFLRRSGAAIAAMTAGWLRVGFCQGNFNADNCLVAGRTMDYGPFGFMDAYDPLFAKWTGSGEHFAFANQPSAGLATSPCCAPPSRRCWRAARRGHGDRRRDGGGFRIGNGKDVARQARVRGGLRRANRGRRGRAVAQLGPLLRDVEAVSSSRFDALVGGGGGPRRRLERRLDDDSNDSRLFEHVACAFYDEKAARSNTKLRRDWVAFLTEWRAAVLGDAGWSAARAAEIKKKMDAANPKYVLREWMLVEAYEAAKLSGDFAPSEALQRLTARPYEEGTEEETARYYRPAPSAFRKPARRSCRDLRKGRTRRRRRFFFTKKTRRRVRPMTKFFRDGARLPTPRVSG